MSYFEFSGKVNIISGENGLEQFGEELSRIGCRHIFVISDKTVGKLDLIDPVIETIVRENGMTASAVYQNVENGSSFQSVEEAYEIYRASSCDSVLAIGGGSVIDTAKALVLMLKTQARDLSRLRTYNAAVAAQRVPFAVVPTTLGGGSEVTRFASIRNDAEQCKVQFVSDLLQPDVCVLDPRMIRTLTPRQLALGATRAMANALGAFISLQSTVVSDKFARQAVVRLRYAMELVRDELSDSRARLYLMQASILAGVARSNAQVGITHAIANAVCAHYPQIELSEALGVLLPQCLVFNKDARADKYAAMFATLAGEDAYLSVSADKRASGLVDCLVLTLGYYHEKFGTPATLAELGVEQDKLAEIASAVVREGNIMTNPKRIREQDVLEILQRSM